MVYMAVSLYVEAKPIIEYYDLRKDLDDRFYQIFKSDNMTLIITGVGKIACAVATSHILSRNLLFDEDIVINMGICGAKNDVQIGTAYIINKIKDASTGKDYYTDVLLKHEFYENSIETFDKPIEDASELEEALCDMESSGFYLSATKYVEQHRIFLIKVVSDRIGVDIVDKNVVSCLIEKNLDKIDVFIKRAQDFMKNDNEIFKRDELDLIDEISCNLKLTKSLREMLYKACLHYKVRTGKDILFLKNNAVGTVNNKKERGKYFELILSYLKQ
ncbi:nucleoside phosphorylase [Thermoanaerobacterium thermosaccharolyticum]|uniref:5'-methylthioadenosine/S-adenosylhomocysteine nucleosidase family protein n=1 Tax=Thermoanaerobacterium thermosaccharolyticum TaxID=1517 RepID=UPI003DA93FCF